jgi:hypothetical protein
MNGIRLYELDRTDAIDYLIASIDVDGRNLSSMASGYLVDGAFVVFAPEGSTHDRLIQMSVGGLLQPTSSHRATRDRVVEVQSLVDNLAAYLCGLASDMRVATAFIREPYLTSSDKSAILNSLQPIGSALYKIVSLEACDQQRLKAEMQLFHVSWSFLLILSSVTSNERDMNMILANATAIAVNAYDGEGYLCWIRSGLHPV